MRTFQLKGLFKYLISSHFMLFYFVFMLTHSKHIVAHIALFKTVLKSGRWLADGLCAVFSLAAPQKPANRCTCRATWKFLAAVEKVEPSGLDHCSVSALGGGTRTAEAWQMRKERQRRRTVFTFASRIMERSRNSVLLKENFTTLQLPFWKKEKKKKSHMLNYSRRSGGSLRSLPVI